MGEDKTVRVGRRLVLASTSPRRTDLLRQLGLRFEVVDPGQAENSSSTDAETRVRENSLSKGRAVAEGLGDGVVIAADTVVLLDEKILEKPRDASDAVNMLQTLSDRVHTVVSAVTVIDVPSRKEDTRVVRTRVKIRNLTEDQVEAYVASGEPLDKAGAYAAQGLGSVLIEWVDGCFYNVVGLPLSLLYDMLRAVGIDVLKNN